MTETSYRMSREQVDAFLAAPRHAIIAAQTSSGGDRMFSRERTFPGCVRVAAVLVTALLVIADASSESHDFVPAFGDLRFGDSEESVSQILGGLSKSSYGRRGKVPTVIAGDSFWVDVDFREDRLWRIVLVSNDGYAAIEPNGQPSGSPTPPVSHHSVQRIQPTTLVSERPGSLLIQQPVGGRSPSCMH